MAWMSKAGAKAEGFTHYGRYYGIPVYLKMNEEPMVVATAHPWLDHVMTLFHYIEGFLVSVFHPSDDRGFMFQVRGEL